MTDQRLLRSFAEAALVSGALTVLVFFAQWNYGYNLADEGFQWYISQRVLFGEMPIRDYFSYDPGRYLWSAAFFKLLGFDGLFEQKLANSCFGLVGLASTYVAMTAAGFRRPMRLAVAAFLAIAMGFPLHKIYEQSFSLIGVAFLAYSLYEPLKGKRWVVLGLVTGIAAIFGRNIGVFVAAGSLLGLLAVWRLHGIKTAARKLTAYGAGVLAGYAPMLLWCVIDQRLGRAMIESIRFTSNWQQPIPIPFAWRITQSFASMYEAHGTLVGWLCIAVFATYALFGFRSLADLAVSTTLGRKQALRLAALCIGLPFLYQGFNRADFVHIAHGILPMFVLIAAQIGITRRLMERVIGGAVVTLSLLCWLPAEPLLSIALERNRGAEKVKKYPIDGKFYYLESTVADVLKESRLLADRCHVKDGQLVAMPYYPGVLAYLHVKAPYPELYYLYDRDEDFQNGAISRLESAGTKVAIVNSKAAMDGNRKYRIDSTNPVLYHYVMSNFSKVELSNETLARFTFLTRNCEPAPGE